MAPVRRQIRPVRIIPHEEVEDQLWPVNLLVVILAGFVVGLVLGLSRFDDPRLFYNAYFQLATVGLTLAIWFAAIRWVRGRLKQRLKIAVLFSLVAHLWLLLSLGVGYYRLVVQTRPGSDKVEELAELTVPDYPESAMEKGEVPSEYHRPVETPLPTPQTPQATKPSQENRPPTLEKPPVPTPKRAESTPLPLPPLERREVSPPHRAEMSGEPIRRQIAEPRQEPIRPVPLPEIRPAAPPKGPSVPKEMLDRQPTQPPQPAAPKTSPPALERPTPSPVAAARREVQPPVETPRTEQAGPNRQVRPAPEASVQAEAPPPQAASASQRPNPYQPRPLAIERFQTTPTDRKPASPVQTPTPAPPPRSSLADRPKEQPLEIAQTPDRLAARQAHRAAKAAVQEEPLPEAAVAPEVRSPLTPAQTTVARQNPTMGRLADRPGVLEPQAALTNPTGPAAVEPVRRPEPSALASWQLQAGPVDRTAPRTAHLPRFDAAAGAESRPTAASTPSALQVGQADSVPIPQQAQSPGLPGHRPAQAQSGAISPVTGVGSPQPAAAARRAQASQEGVEGILEPTQAVGLLPRRQSGAALPTGDAPHEDASLAGAVGSAQSSGGDQLRPWEAGSQTALARQSPGAPIGQANRSAPTVSPAAPSGPGGAVTGAARPSDAGGPAMPFGQRPELGRTRTGADRLAGLEGAAPQTVPDAGTPGSSALAGTGNGSAQEVGSFQPGTISVGRTTAGAGLPGSRAAGEASWQVPSGGGAVALAQLRRSGGGGEPTTGWPQEGGFPGPSRHVGRLPTADLAGKVPEAGTSSDAGGSPQKGPPSGGEPSGDSGEVALPGGNRSGAGLPDSLASGRPGGVGHTPGGSPGSGTGPVGGVALGTSGKVRQNEAGEDGLGNALAGRGIPRTVRTDLPGTEAVVTPGAGGSGVQAGTPSGASGSLGGEGVEVGRQAGGLPVHMAAPVGVGGLSGLPSPLTGVPTRRAHPQSEEIHLAAPGRFLLDRSAGRLAIDGRAAPAEAFRQRNPARRAQEAQKYGGSEASEQAVERGLAFLAKLQWPDGRWRFHAIPESLAVWPGEPEARQQPDLLVKMAQTVLQENPGPDPAQQIHQRRSAIQQLLERHSAGGLDRAGMAQLAQVVREAVFMPGRQESDSAATGLALLAFLGAGYTHQEGPYRTQVQRGLEWLLANQKPDGDLWGYAQGSSDTWLYSHGIAAIALCEAYGMTRDPALRQAAERAVGFIVAAQHPTRGGWRYR
ncbi:MAG TPA: hypothetical protein PK777_04265, partial [Thermoguttaceae bacterium]|nr:hypothetical protein [Thermoguttaceae bacterium]